MTVLTKTIPATVGRIAVATLSAEKTLNALSFAMVAQLREALEEWRRDDTVAAVLLRGAGKRAFCAGGDLQDIYRLMHAGDFAGADDYFAAEYLLDYALHRFPKPLIGFGDGVVMGGGMGLLQGASCRVVTERSSLAMPEARIGFFPDVGADWFLRRMPFNLGLFCGISGARLSGAEARRIGLADRLFSAARAADLPLLLSDQDWTRDPRQNRIVAEQFLKQEEDATFAEMKNLDTSDFYFRGVVVRSCEHPTLPATLAALRDEEKNVKGEPRRLADASMAAAVLFWRRWRDAPRGEGLREVFVRDFNIAQALVRDGEFLEGIRALIIDKDKKPRWKFGDTATGDCEAAEQWADGILAFDGGDRTRRFAESLETVK